MEEDDNMMKPPSYEKSHHSTILFDLITFDQKELKNQPKPKQPPAKSPNKPYGTVPNPNPYSPTQPIHSNPNSNPIVSSPVYQDDSVSLGDLSSAGGGGGNMRSNFRPYVLNQSSTSSLIGNRDNNDDDDDDDDEEDDEDERRNRNRSRRDSSLATFMNFLWILFGGGLIMFLLYVIMAFIISLTLMGWPMAGNTFRQSFLVLFPFGKRVRTERKITPCSIIVLILWIPFGVFLYLLHMILCLVLTLTLVGIPFASQHFRLARLAIWPATFTVAHKQLTCKEVFSFETYVDDSLDWCDKLQIDV